MHISCLPGQGAFRGAHHNPDPAKSGRRRWVMLCCLTPSVANNDAEGIKGPGAAGVPVDGKASQLPVIQVSATEASLAEDSVSSDTGTPPPSPSSDRGEQPPPCAMSFNRPYTVEDWDAMVAHIREHGSEVFYDARSYASSTSSADSGVDQLGDGPAAAASTSRGAAARQAASAAVPRSLVPKGAAAPWTPQPALEWADPSWEYRPVDARAFYGFWRRCMTRSTPPPFPTNLALQSNSLTRAIQESVIEMELRESADRHCLEVVPKPEFMPVPASMGYTERFPLDGSEGRWTVRRDITSLGHSTGQVYMTTDDILVVRVHSYGVFGRTPAWFAEDYMRLEDGGRTLVAKLGAMDMSTKRQGHNLVVLFRF